MSAPQLIQLNPLHPFPSQPALQGDRKRVAFVTGAGQGIGRAVAIRLGSDGLNVAINDLNYETLAETKTALEATGALVLVLVGDVSDERRVEDMVDETVAELGYLDVMIANAGIAIHKPLLETTKADWERIYQVNVEGVRLCFVYAAKQFIKQGTGGKLVAASSMAGLTAMSMLGAYSASKFAVRGLVQAAAIELAEHGITANSYAPGYIATPIVNAVDSRTPFLDVAIPTVPLKRIGTPEDVANLVSFLASRDSDYITGQILSVNGGTTIL